VPDNLGWEITPGDHAEIKRHSHWQDAPRMLEPCNTCGHPRRMHDPFEMRLDLWKGDWPGRGELCAICGGQCIPLGSPNHPQKRGF
jgi:hypothetical protein